MIARLRFRPDSSRKQVSSARAFTSHGWPRVRSQIVSSAAGSNACPVSPVCCASNAVTSVPGEVAQAHRTGLDVEGAAPRRSQPSPHPSGCGNRARPARRTGRRSGESPPDAARIRPATGAAPTAACRRRGRRSHPPTVPSGFASASDQRDSTSPSPPAGPCFARMPGQASSRKPSPNVRSGPGSQLAENRPHRRLDVLAHRLRGLDVDVNAPVVAFPATVEQVPQGQQGGRLARLPRRVQHEVALGPDQVEDVPADSRRSRGGMQ